MKHFKKGQTRNPVVVRECLTYWACHCVPVQASRLSPVKKPPQDELSDQTEIKRCVSSAEASGPLACFSVVQRVRPPSGILYESFARRSWLKYDCFADHATILAWAPTQSKQLAAPMSHGFECTTSTPSERAGYIIQSKPQHPLFIHKL